MKTTLCRFAQYPIHMIHGSVAICIVRSAMTKALLLKLIATSNRDCLSRSKENAGQTAGNCIVNAFLVNPNCIRDYGHGSLGVWTIAGNVICSLEGRNCIMDVVCRFHLAWRALANNRQVITALLSHDVNIQSIGRIIQGEELLGRSCGRNGSITLIWMRLNVSLGCRETELARRGMPCGLWSRSRWIRERSGTANGSCNKWW